MSFVRNPGLDPKDCTGRPGKPAPEDPAAFGGRGETDHKPGDVFTTADPPAKQEETDS